LFSNLPIGIDGYLDYCVDFDDFTKSVNDATNNWIIVKDASATVLMGTGDVENGVMTITSNATTDDDGGSFQRAETIFLCKSGKQLWFEARVKASDADQHDMFVGLADNFGTDPEAVVAEGVARVGFEILDGDASILTSIDDDTATTGKLDTGIDMADDTYVRLGFRTDGGSVRFYVDRALVATRSIPSAIAAVTLGPVVFNLSGNATGTHSAKCDYIFAAQKRV
jgi:hypothetical protein